MDSVATQSLESQSLWYKYKTKVWLEESEQTASVHNIMRVLRSIHNSGNLAYVSVPITSGKFLYNLMLERPFMKKEAQIKMAIEHNYKAGWDFVDVVIERRDCPVLYPADLIPAHQEWEQVHFQALWLSIIAEKCTELHMSEGWEYSNGGSEEFVHAWQLRLGMPNHPNLVFFNTKETEKFERERMKNITVYNYRGEIMSIYDGMRALEKSLTWLKRRRIEAKTLETSLILLHQTEQMIKDGFYQ